MKDQDSQPEDGAATPGPARISRRELLTGMAGALALSSTGAAKQAAAQPRPGGTPAARQPNIVMMLLDNLGFGDFSCYVGPIRGVATPRIDEFASQGIRLTNFNTEPECTPSRSALLTGRMPVRSGTASVQTFASKDGMSPWEYTLAELLSDAGYATACYGKWHLGSSEDRLPNNQGFDEWYGIPRSSGEAAWPLQPGFDPEEYELQPVLEGRRGERNRVVTRYDHVVRAHMDRELTNRAADYVRRKAAEPKPFFLYVPFTLPHFPPLAHPDFVVPGRTQYQNVLAEIDHNVGRVLDAIAQAGITEDTIVIVASENGPQTMHGIGSDYGAQSDTGPFRGEFPSAWEGAIRTPCIMRWPGRIRAGRVSNEIVSLLDFYRTLAGVAGATDRIPADRAMDSVDLSAFLFNDQEKSGRDHVMWFYRDELLAIKWRNFKMHFTLREPATGPAVVPGQNVTGGVRTEVNYPWLFNIDNDPKELWNVASANPWVRGGPMARIRREYEASVAEFPNIVAGVDEPPKPARRR